MENNIKNVNDRLKELNRERKELLEIKKQHLGSPCYVAVYQAVKKATIIGKFQYKYKVMFESGQKQTYPSDSVFFSEKAAYDYLIYIITREINYQKASIEQNQKILDDLNKEIDGKQWNAPKGSN